MARYLHGDGEACIGESLESSSVPNVVAGRTFSNAGNQVGVEVLADGAEKRCGGAAALKLARTCITHQSTKCGGFAAM
jgi:hypothetical protein